MMLLPEKVRAILCRLFVPLYFTYSPNQLALRIELFVLDS